MTNTNETICENHCLRESMFSLRTRYHLADFEAYSQANKICKGENKK